MERRKSVAPFVVAGDRYVPLIQQAGLGGADLLIAIGGGSATGLAKAIALTTGLSIVAVPTTYAGSAAPCLGSHG